MPSLSNIIKRPINMLKSVAKDDLLLKLIISIGLFGVLLLIFIMSAAPIRYNLKAGDIAYEDIYAPSEMVDKAATELLKSQAEEKVEPEYEYDLTVQIDITKKIESLFNEINTVKNSENMDMEQKISYLEQQSPVALQANEYKLMLNSSEEDIEKLNFNINYIVTQILSQSILDTQLEEKKEKAREFFNEITEESKLNFIGSDIASELIRPNLYINVKKN